MIAQGEQLVIKGYRHSRRSGFTLAELFASMTIMVILMGAMTSTILIASHAIPDSEDVAVKKSDAMDVVDQMAGELFYATSITEETASAVTFTVADRGHGSVGPELIRYEWSGTPGDPLTRQYNSETVVTVCEEVKQFSLEFVRHAKPLFGPPRVLLFVDDDMAPTAQDEAKRQMIESWGFTVQVLGASRGVAEQQVALQSADVVYLAQAPSGAPVTVPALLGQSLGVGIVCEEQMLFREVGISQSSNWVSLDSIDILDNTHEITQPFALGTLQIFSTIDDGVSSLQAVAPGGQVLATDGALSYDMLVAIEVNADLYGGGKAPSRRVSLPWGDNDFDFNGVTADGLTLMRRAIVWAAAPIVYSGVRIVLKLTGNGKRIRTEVQVFNTPTVNSP